MNWNINIDQLPGPDRKKWHYLDDREHVSPDGKILALIYSIAEINMGWDIGQLAFYAGPKDSPSSLLIEPEFKIMAYCQKEPWLDNSTCSFSAYMWDGKKKTQIPFLIIDLTNRTFALYPIMNSCMSILSVSNDGWIIREITRDGRFQSHQNEQIQRNHLRWYSWGDVKKAKADYWEGFLGKPT